MYSTIQYTIPGHTEVKPRWLLRTLKHIENKETMKNTTYRYSIGSNQVKASTGHPPPSPNGLQQP